MTCILGPILCDVFVEGGATGTPLRQSKHARRAPRLLPEGSAAHAEHALRWCRLRRVETPPLIQPLVQINEAVPDASAELVVSRASTTCAPFLKSSHRLAEQISGERFVHQLAKVFFGLCAAVHV